MSDAGLMDLARRLTPVMAPHLFGRLDTVIPNAGARVYNSANISITNNTLTDLTFNSERWDTAGFHDTGANTARLTLPQSGFYLFWGNVEFAVNGVGRRQVLLVVNGATTIAIEERDVALAGAIDHIVQISTIYKLSAGDYVTLRVYQNSGGALNVNAKANWSPEFAVQRLA